MVRVIHPCCVLHNIANTNDLEIFEAPVNDEEPDNEAQIQEIVIDNEIPIENESGAHLRDQICRQLFPQ